MRAQVRYEIVTEEELEEKRAQFRNGQLAIKIEETTFSMKCAPRLLLPAQHFLHANAGPTHTYTPEHAIILRNPGK